MKNLNTTWKYIFIVISCFCIFFILTSCNENVTEPEFNDSVLFIEYGLESATYLNNGNQVRIGGKEVYQFNEHNRSLKVNSDYADPLDPSTKFVFGRYVTAYDRSEDFIQETDFPAWLGIGVSGHTHSIRVIDCTPQGEIKVSYTPYKKEEMVFTLKPGDVFQNLQIGTGIINPINSFSYTDVITIANKGFIKKSNITYY